MAKITADMTIARILEIDPNASGVFMDAGMYCFGCPASQMETLKEVAELYGFNVNDMLDTLNDATTDAEP